MYICQTYFLFDNEEDGDMVLEKGKTSIEMRENEAKIEGLENM